MYYLREAEGEKGKSHLFLPGDCKEGSLPPEALAFEWGDLDEEARDFGRRRRLRQDFRREILALRLGDSRGFRPHSPAKTMENH